MRNSMIKMIINAISWALPTIVVVTFILPQYGVGKDFTSLQIASVIAGVNFFSFHSHLYTLVSKIENKQMSADLLLPTSIDMILLQKVTFFCIYGVVMSVIIFILAYCIYYSSGMFAQMNILKLLFVIFITSMAKGLNTLLLAGCIEKMVDIENIIMRFMFPLWFLGGFQFSWEAILKTSKWFAYINLLNPYFHEAEMFRSSLLEGKFVPFSLSISVTVIYSILFWYIAKRQFKKKLDLPH
ncbi:ABC transporter permease [Candidatus Sneabacter namystus]|nr:ABC transporter permease [Candidatus Sneabacter namystus]